MTFEQLMQEMFVNHWLALTFFMPVVTLVYAWITDQTAWWICSLLLAITYAGASSR